MTMAVYDRWHRRPKDGEKPCEHRDRVKGPLYPGADHGKGMRWQVRYYDDKGVQQKRNFEHRGGRRDETDPEIYALAYDAKIKAELNADTYVDPKAGDISFEEYAREVVAGRTASADTRKKMIRRLELHVFPVIGKASMKTLAKRPSVIQGLVNRLENESKLGPGFIRLIMLHVGTVFNVAIDDEIVAKNPCKKSTVQLPQNIKADLVPWTVEQVAAVREALGAEPPPVTGRGHRPRDHRRYAASVDVGAGLGLRIAEMLALSPDDLDRKRHVVKVRRQIRRVQGVLCFTPPKYGKVREAELADVVDFSLRRHAEQYPPVRVTLPWKEPGGRPTTVRLYFTNVGGGPVHASSFGEAWRAATVAAGVRPPDAEDLDWEPGEEAEEGEEEYAERYGFHQLRHYFASMMITGGESIKAVSLWLGHSKIQTTLDLYTHFMPSSRDRGRAIVDAGLYPSRAPSALDVPSERLKEV